ncbi:MAG: hypothetical protein HYV07_19005 [Deltaproteobacteria bacterium]|nr:hypothetical protein [Deltaproteobacteria bacterium]
MVQRIGGGGSPASPAPNDSSAAPSAPKEAPREGLADGFARADAEPRTRLDPPPEAPALGFMETVRRHPKLSASALAAATLVPASMAHAATNEVPPPTEPTNTDLSDSILFGDHPEDGKLVRLLKGVLRLELYKSREVNVASVSGEFGGVRIAAKTRIISPTDPLVAKNPTRAAVTKSSIEAGKPVTWALVGGGLYPRVHAGYAFPAGPVNISFGGSLRGALDYSVLAPYTVEASSVADAAKNLSTRLPLDSKSARELTGGTEVTIRGAGHVNVHAGASISRGIIEVPAVTVGASAGVSHSTDKTVGLSLVVERLGADKVKVGIDSWDILQNTESGHLSVGVDSHLGELVNLGEGTSSSATDALTNLLDKQLERWLKLELRGTHAEWAAKDDKGRYVIDLSKPGGQKAYDELMHRFLSLTGAKKVDVAAPLGDGVAAVRTWMAAPLAEAPLSDVRSANLLETRHGNSDAFTITFGPLELLRSISSAEAKHGTVTTPAGVITYDRATLVDAHGDILTRWWNGKRATEREYVSASFPGEAASSYYHARHTVANDGITTKNDVRRFVALADMLGSLPSADKGLEGNKAFLGRFDSSDRVIDIYLTDTGFQKLASSTDAEIHAAFAKSYERIDRPWKMDYLWGNDSVWKTTPWLATDHPKHSQLMWLLEKGPEPNNTSGSGHGATRDQQYRSITGRSLAEDSAAYKEAKSLVSLIGKIRATSDPAERAEILAAAEEDLDLDIARELATFAALAGPEDVIVKDLRIVDRTHKKDFVLVSEGSIADPAGRIHHALENP